MEEQNKFLVPLAIVVAGALVAGAVYFGGAKQPTTDNRQPTTSGVDVKPVSDADHIRGSRSAELIIIEYSDTECPFCKTFHSTMKEILSSYGGRVAWVYRHFPIQQLHAKAIKEAEATECAAELGGNMAFWNYLDEIFERTNSNDSLPETELSKIAGDIGLDVESFNSCLNSGRYNQKIEESIAEAVKAGARGTPHSIIVSQDGEKVVINGAEPIASVRQKIDSLLK